METVVYFSYLQQLYIETVSYFQLEILEMVVLSYLG